ncbi:Na+/H+ antiporter NhaA [Leucobacter viscericola]|nr:Na+/H+ antiporter NhaA [Leucobacter viscericola]
MNHTPATSRLSHLLRGEITGGVILVIAAAAGFIAANSPLAEQYFALRDTKLGPAGLGLQLSLGHWASDGLLAIFFFMVGLELKQEFITGALRRVSTAIVPVAAAVGGVAIPAVIYLAINAGTSGAEGWAIPTATDIAFAVAILGLIAPGIPPALRIFLLTLAVVDDLIAITIIAVFFTEQLQLLPLVIALVPLALFAVIARTAPAWLARSAWGPWVALLPLGIVVWALFLASGIHPTVAGVVLAFLIPVRGRDGTPLAKTLEHRYSPLSAGVAIPIFAFFAAGIAVSGTSNFPLDPIAIGVILGLVVGKPVGITLTTWLLTRFTSAKLDPAIRWRQLVGVGALAGVGFTVSLLVAELSLSDPAEADTARLAVLVASVLAIAVAALFLARRR